MKSIAQFKKENPQYENEPDLKLVDFLYTKYYKDRGVDETEFYKLAFPNIAAKRVEEEIDVIEAANLGMQLTPPKEDFKPTVEELAETSGVSLNTPATKRARVGASFGYNEEQKALAIKNSLSKLYKQDIDVRVGPSTGELEYYNPEIQRYALVDKPGFEIADITDLTGDAMVILPDLAVTYFTAGIGKAIGLGAAAAGVGEYARLKLGQTIYQVNMDLTDQELFMEGLKMAGISLGAGVSAVGIAKAIKGVNNMIKGRSFFQTEAAVKSLQDPKFLEADEVANAINIKLEDAGVQSRLKYTLAEALDDKNLLATQSSFENVRRLGKTEEFREFGKNQAIALNDYFKQLKSVYGSPTGSTYDTGKMINEVIEKRQSNVIKNIVKKQEVSDELLTKKIFKLPNGNSKVTGVEFRSIIDDLSKSYKSDAKKAATQLDKASGVKLIDTDEIAKALNQLSEKEKRILINTAKTEGIFKSGVYDQLLSKDSKILLSDARETISALGKLIREKEIGLAAGETVDVGRLKFLSGAFTEQVKKNAGIDYLNELQKFNELVRSNKELLNNDIISQLTKIDIGNVLKVGDEAIFETTFKKGVNNAKAAKEVYDVISKSPEALNTYKNSIFGKYKTEVLDEITKKPNITRHNAFMQNYAKPLRIFFNEAEFNKISRIGGLQRNIEKTNKLFTNTQKELKNSFQGKLVNTSPSEVFNKIFKQGKFGEVQELKRILSKNPDVYKKFQRDVLTDLNERVTIRSDRLSMDKVLDPKAFNQYLNGRGGERGYKSVLREIFGDEYVKNLETLNRALQITGRRMPRAQEAPLANAFTDIIRARLGQFTTRGRLFTAGRRLFMLASNKMIARALLSPTSLKELLELKYLKRGSKRAAAIFSKLGGSIFILSDEEVAPPPKDAVIEQGSDIKQNIEPTSSLPTNIQTENVAQNIAPLPESPNINPAAFSVASIDQTGLTPSENAFLDEQEKVMKLRERGIA